MENYPHITFERRFLIVGRTKFRGEVYDAAIQLEHPPTQELLNEAEILIRERLDRMVDKVKNL